MTEKNHIDLPSEKKGVWLTLVILSFFTLLSIIILYFIFINNYGQVVTNPSGTYLANQAKVPS